MTILRKLLTGTVATALIAAPAAAQAMPARTSTPVGEAEQAVGSSYLIVGGLVAIIVLFLILDGSDDDEPASP